MARCSTALLVVLGTVLGFATPAFAHHPALSGTARCINGQWVITWTISNSESTSGSNRTMTVDQIGVTASSGVTGLAVSGVAVGTSFPPATSANWTRTATTTLAGTVTGSVTLTVRADWSRSGPQNVSRTATVSLPGSCQTPAAPGATIDLSCADGGARVILTNTGGTPVTFTVKKGTASLATVTVPGAGSVTKIYAMAEDETATYSVTAPGLAKVSTTLTKDCQKPAAAISADCTDGFTVVLSNGGSQPVAFTITRPDGSTETVSLAGVAPAVSRRYPLSEGQTATVSVSAPSMTTVSKTTTPDCQKPDAGISANCTDGAVIVLSNQGGLTPVTFTVKKGDTVVETKTVESGDPYLLRLPLQEDETATFSVSAAGFATLTGPVTNNCQNPAATVTSSCAGGVVVTMTNTGAESPVQFRLLQNDGAPVVVTVEGGGTEIRTFPLDDEPVTFEVSAGGMASVKKVVAEDCPAPTTTTTTAGESPTTTVMGAVPVAVLDHSCDASGAVATLTNRGGSAVVFTVTRNGSGVESVSVDGGKTISRTYVVGEDESVAFLVSAPGMTVVQTAFTHDCDPFETEVLGVQLVNPDVDDSAGSTGGTGGGVATTTTAPAPAEKPKATGSGNLPFTGANSMHVLFFAAALATVGVAFLVIGRRALGREEDCTP
jgi:hypothetical protein